VFGIALVYGISGKFKLGELAAVSATDCGNKIFLFGLAWSWLGSASNPASVSNWAPDVCEGAACLHYSLLRSVPRRRFCVAAARAVSPQSRTSAERWSNLLSSSRINDSLRKSFAHSATGISSDCLVIQACACRLHLLASRLAGRPSGILYYLSGYLFTVLGAFTVICLGAAPG